MAGLGDGLVAIDTRALVDADDSGDRADTLEFKLLRDIRSCSPDTVVPVVTTVIGLRPDGPFMQTL